jgi:hypothetical protein
MMLAVCLIDAEHFIYTAMRKLIICKNLLKSKTLLTGWKRKRGWPLTLSNPIFLPPAYSPALIYFGQERGWWITCNFPTVLKEKNRKIIMSDFVRHYDFPVPDAFPQVVRTLTNR